MKKIIGALLLLCVLGIYLNSIIDQKGLNKTNEYVTNDSYSNQDMQEPDPANQLYVPKSQRKKSPEQQAIDAEQAAQQEQDTVDKLYSDETQTNAFDRNETESNPNTLTPEVTQRGYIEEAGVSLDQYTQKNNFYEFIPFVLLGILGIYFVTRKKN